MFEGCVAAAVVQDYVAGYSVPKIRAKYGGAYTKIVNTLRAAGVHVRNKKEARAMWSEDDRNAYLPSPEEIAAETARIRARWSEEERASRVVHKVPEVAVPVGLILGHERRGAFGNNYDPD